MKNYQKGFIVPLLLAIIAVLLVGGGIYVYKQNEKSNQPVVTASTSQTTIVGTYTNARIKDSTTLLFSDRNGKTWTVDYRNASFSQYSYSYGNVKGTNGLTDETLQDWLKWQSHVNDKPATIPDGPGTVTIIGAVNIDGVLVASSIKVEGQ